MNFSTVPPCRATARSISSKYRAMTPARASGSSRSPSSVEPVTSQNTTVTVLRTSDDADAAAASRGAPQNGQNANSAELSRPQEPQVTIPGRV